MLSTKWLRSERAGGRAGARGAEVRGTNRIPRPAAHGDAVKVLSWSDWDAVRNRIRGLNPDPRFLLGVHEFADYFLLFCFVSSSMTLLDPYSSVSLAANW